jgi:predicted acylesterase/phospholipase RssA
MDTARLLTPEVLNAETLILPGGGVRLVFVVGALKELARRGADFGTTRRRLRRVVGVSAGAMLALCIALRCSADEIEALMQALLDSEYLHLDLSCLLSKEHKSIADPRLLTSFVTDLLVKRLGTAELTLAELRARTDVDLSVYAFDLSSQTTVCLNAERTPHVPVVKAVYASMALPLVFPPVVLEDGHILVDGGVGDNCPVSDASPETTLAFRFSSQHHALIGPLPAVPLVTYAVSIIHALLNTSNKLQAALISPEHRRRCITIDIGHIRVFEASLPASRRNQMMEVGARAVADAVTAWQRGAAPTWLATDRFPIPPRDADLVSNTPIDHLFHRLHDASPRATPATSVPLSAWEWAPSYITNHGDACNA